MRFEVRPHSLGMCLPKTETALAKSLPQSAMTVSVKGMPMRAKQMQKTRPLMVTGTMLP